MWHKSLSITIGPDSSNINRHESVVGMRAAGFLYFFSNEITFTKIRFNPVLTRRVAALANLSRIFKSLKRQYEHSLCVFAKRTREC